MDINFILRLVVIILLIIWRVYWFMAAKNSMVNKPKTDNTSRATEFFIFNVSAIYILVNLLGYVVFPFHNLWMQLIGFILVISGFTEAITARKTLADNWTEAFEFQIKKDHELITKGIYGYVRHPIYGGLILMAPGSLLVSESYTFIIGLIIMLFMAEKFAHREEKLLTKHFVKKYTEYMKTTKKFIPFVY